MFNYNNTTKHKHIALQNKKITMFNEMAPENCFSLYPMEPTDWSRLIVGREDMMKLKVDICLCSCCIMYKFADALVELVDVT